MTADQKTEFTTFLPNWQKVLRENPNSEAHKQQIIQEGASWIAESHKLDPWFYKINKKGELVSIQTGELVKKVIGKRRFDYTLGEQEYQAVCRMEELIGEEKKEDEEKRIVLISDPYEGIYKDTKVVISEIVRKGNERFLFNRAILLDTFDTKKCRQFALNLGQNNLTQLRDLRANPFLLETNDQDWTQVLSRAGHSKELDKALKLINMGTDVAIKERSLVVAREMVDDMVENGGKIIPYERFAAKMGERNVFGKHRTSCPVKQKGLNENTILEQFLENSEVIKVRKWETGECRMCNTKNTLVGECRVCKNCENQDNLKKLAWAA